MTTYKIISPDFVCAVSINADKVIESGPTIGWAVGKDWAFARKVIEQRGWKIEPLIAPSFEIEHPTLTFRGIKYTIYMQWNTINRIVSTDRDGIEQELTYSQLPEELKALI